MQHDAKSHSLLSEPGGCTFDGSAVRSVSPRCATVSDDSPYLRNIPPEIRQHSAAGIELTRYLREGEVVLHLGSGSGLVCYVAAQIVGLQGRVFGIEEQEKPLALSRKHLPQLLERSGVAPIEFRKALSYDLRLDLERLDALLQEHPARHSRDWLRVEEQARSLRTQAPLIESESVDVVLIDGVWNDTPRDNRRGLLTEILRVLKRGGRAVVSETVSDEVVPAELQADVSHSSRVCGASREDQLLEAFEATGFHGLEIVRRQVEPSATIAGIEFRHVTMQAFKGKAGPCFERNQAVIYNGPWKAVIDDDGHTLYRGKRMAVCDKTYQLYSQAPYADHITPVPPAQEVSLAQAKPFQCNSNTERDPRVTKDRTPSGLLLLPQQDGECCGPAGCC